MMANRRVGRGLMVLVLSLVPVATPTAAMVSSSTPAFAADAAGLVDAIRANDSSCNVTGPVIKALPSGLPAVGSALPTLTKDEKGASLPVPSAKALEAATAFRNSLTDTQKTAITAAMTKHKDELTIGAKGLPEPSNGPKAQAGALSDKSPAPDLPGTATAKAAASAIDRNAAQFTADVNQILTADQRTLLAASAPADVCPPLTARSDSPSNDGSDSNANSVPDTKSTSDDRTKTKKESEESRQRKERSNMAGMDEYHTEGNVLGVRCDASQPVPSVVAGPVPFDPEEAAPYALIGMKDGLQQIRFIGDTANQCASINVGDYVQVDGVKQNESVFDVEDVSVDHAQV